MARVGRLSDIDFGSTTAKIVRRGHARTITVGAFPAGHALPSEVLARIKPELDTIKNALPPARARARAERVNG